jgi:hypothetical protein
MAKNEHIVALEADPNDPEDFAVTQQALDAGVRGRRTRREAELARSVVAAARALGGGARMRLLAA